MKRMAVEYTFLVLVLAVISMLFFVPDSIGNQSGAAVDTDTSYVQLISPDNRVDVETETPTFTYTVKNAPYATCSVIIDDTIVEREKVEETIRRPAEGRATAELRQGAHSWKVKCTLPSRETVASTISTFTIDTDDSTDESELPPSPGTPGNEVGRAVTGNVAMGGNTGTAGVFIALVGIACVIWGIRFSRRDEDL